MLEKYQLTNYVVEFDQSPNLGYLFGLKYLEGLKRCQTSHILEGFFSSHMPTIQRALQYLVVSLNDV
jgi:hypothetical protein